MGRRRLRVSMRRLVIALAVGVLTTIGVSWRFAVMDILNPPSVICYVRSGEIPGEMWHPLRRPDSLSVRVSRATGRVRIFSHTIGPSYTAVMFAEPQRFHWTATPPLDVVPWWCRSEALPWFFGHPWPEGGDAESRSVWASGWPFWALSSCKVKDASGRMRTESGIEISSTRAILTGQHPKTALLHTSVLPYRPIWHGFILNTLLAAAIWWGAWEAIGFLVRARQRIRCWWRRRRDRCVRCGYPRAGLPSEGACPECGVACKPSLPVGPP